MCSEDSEQTPNQMYKSLGFSSFWFYGPDVKGSSTFIPLLGKKFGLIWAMHVKDDQSSALCVSLESDNSSKIL